MPRGFVVQIAGLLAVLTVSVVVGLSGHMLIAQAVSVLGTIAVLGGVLEWVVFVDSKRRWPGISAFDRFARVITFYRR